MINESKTEEYEIIRQGNEKWKKCKLLGSLLDTENDINRRKSLEIYAFKTLNKCFDSRKISNAVTIRTFNAYVARVFLYNSELWTLTKKMENTVNTFQRRHLRKVLGVHSRDTSQTSTRWISEESQTTQRKTTAHMDGTDQTWSENNRNTRL